MELIICSCFFHTSYFHEVGNLGFCVGREWSSLIWGRYHVKAGWIDGISQHAIQRYGGNQHSNVCLYM